GGSGSAAAGGCSTGGGATGCAAAAGCSGCGPAVGSAGGVSAISSGAATKRAITTPATASATIDTSAKKSAGRRERRSSAGVWVIGDTVPADKLSARTAPALSGGVTDGAVTPGFWAITIMGGAGKPSIED